MGNHHHHEPLLRGCNGPEGEPSDTEHILAADVALHLQKCFQFVSAPALVDAYGAGVANQALWEYHHIIDRAGIQSPAGWLAWRIRQLGQGARPMDRGQGNGRANGRSPGQEDNRAKYLEEYQRRRGRLPWEPEAP